MTKGIGVDMADVRELKRLCEDVGEAFVRRTFTEAERREAAAAPDFHEYLAGRFAVKEAVFKALAQLTPEKTFDFRLVETLKKEDGSPCITITPHLAAIMEKAGAERLLVSITTQAPFAMAFVLAEGE